MCRSSARIDPVRLVRALHCPSGYTTQKRTYANCDGGRGHAPQPQTAWSDPAFDGAADVESLFPMELGYHTCKQTELCRIGTTEAPPPRIDRGVRELIVAPMREHSRKPGEQYGRIEAMYAGPYIELLARQSGPAWDAWGLETAAFRVEGAIAVPPESVAVECAPACATSDARTCLARSGRGTTTIAANPPRGDQDDI